MDNEPLLCFHMGNGSEHPTYQASFSKLTSQSRQTSVGTGSTLSNHSLLVIRHITFMHRMKNLDCFIFLEGFKYISLLCTWVFFLYGCKCIHVIKCPQMPERGFGCPGARVKRYIVTIMSYYELNPGPEKKRVHLIIEPSLQPHLHLINIYKHDRWNLTLTPFLARLTQSSVFASGFQKYTCLAYLCFLLFHFIFVPIVTLPSWWKQFFSIDYAITDVPTSNSPTLQLIAKDS